MPTDWRGAVLGSLDSVRKSISRQFPDTDWRDPSWGMYFGTQFTFEFNISSQDPCDGFMIHVRGRTDAAVSQLLSLARSTGWYLLDCSRGEWMHHCIDPSSG
jgi:hypothetical protein